MDLEPTDNPTEQQPEQLWPGQLWPGQLWIDRWRELLRREGLLALGAVDLTDTAAFAADATRFDEWLAGGKQAGMAFLEKYRHLRHNPGQLLEGARTALIVGLPYVEPKSAEAPNADNNGIAAYAHYRDYHRSLKQKLLECVQKTSAVSSFKHEFRICVDSAPVLERALARRTDAGFIGKNTCYIHPQFGSFLLLAEVFTTAALPPSKPAEISLERKTKAGGCGPCTLCQTACPTGALNEAYQLDASKCLAYWTIEHRGPVPREYWPYFAEYWFGCDLCQTACPYNKTSSLNVPSWFERREYPALEAIAVMDQAQYESWFGGTPLTRPGKEGLQRNAAIALWARRSPKLKDVCDQLQLSPSPLLSHLAAQLLHTSRHCEGEARSNPVG